ncbi:MAG: DNA polymerase IV [Parafilimonas terrae]|nr:DNA polymerase IV [Parafilimonas terrae]
MQSASGAPRPAPFAARSQAVDPRPRKIIHIDMDAFYASVEQRDDPTLRGKPVAVGGSSLRGVVAAASYEARRFGVRSAMASVTARRRCPDLVFVKPRFAVYKEISQAIRAIFADYTDLIEPLSLDEAYLDVTDNRRAIASATEIAQQIRARILAETQLTASAGVSYNKFLAKLASDHRKPDGLFVIPPSAGARFVETLPVERFHGIGPVTARRMNGLGILTGADLKARSRPELDEAFGKAGAYYHDLARAIDHRPVRADRVRKSVGSERTFFDDLTAFDAMAEGLRPEILSVWDHCARAGGVGRTITVKIKYADFRTVTRSRTLPRPASSLGELESVGFDLLRSVLPLRKPVRLLGLSVSNFGGVAQEPATVQLALLF